MSWAISGVWPAVFLIGTGTGTIAMVNILSCCLYLVRLFVPKARTGITGNTQ
jgi:hypothetical protein